MFLPHRCCFSLWAARPQRGVTGVTTHLASPFLAYLLLLLGVFLQNLGHPSGVVEVILQPAYSEYLSLDLGRQILACLLLLGTLSS